MVEVVRALSQGFGALGQCLGRLHGHRPFFDGCCCCSLAPTRLP